MVKFILGIDPGMINTGWGVIKIENNNAIYVDEGNIKTKSSLPLEDRIYNIFLEVNKIFNIHNIDYAGIEETFVNINPKTSLELAHARSAAILSIKNNNCDCISINNKKLKKYISSFGGATKTDMAKNVGLILPNAKLLNEHSVDALAVALYCYVNLHNIENKQNDKSGFYNNLKIIG